MSYKRGANKPRPQTGGQRSNAQNGQQVKQTGAARSSRPNSVPSASRTASPDALETGGDKMLGAGLGRPNTPVAPDISAPSQEAKREARMQRQAVARAASERRRRMQLLRRIGIIAALVIVVVGGISAYVWNEANKPGESVAQMASQHIADVTTPHPAYSTDPPTSGPHVNRLAAWGVSATAVPKEEEVHNLEDGGVVISYDPNLDQATLTQLENIVHTYDTQVLMAPYPGLSTPIALTAWGRIDRLNAVDEARIKRFINAYRSIDHHAQSGS